jgi:hypothetical protein
MIVVTVIFHVAGLTWLDTQVTRAMRGATAGGNFLIAFATVMGVATLLVILLHGLEAVAWAWVYRGLGALPDGKSAMLYSLSAMTSYGHERLFLADQWRLMGALEALNGMILFGLTTAFLYGMIQAISPKRLAAAPIDHQEESRP